MNDKYKKGWGKKVENHESIYNIDIPVNLSDFRMISGVGSSLTIKGLNLGIEDCVRLVYNRIILNSTISAHDIMHKIIGVLCPTVF